MKLTIVCNLILTAGVLILSYTIGNKLELIVSKMECKKISNVTTEYVIIQSNDEIFDVKERR